MPHFNIIKSPADIHLPNKWVESSKFDSKDRIVNRKGQRADSSYTGHRYQLIKKYERKIKLPERIARGILGAPVVAITGGLALLCKPVRHLYTKSKLTRRYGVSHSAAPPVKPSAPQPEDQSRGNDRPGIRRPEKGLPNPHWRTCYMNAAVMALFPISGLFKDIENPLLQKVSLAYENPDQHAVALELMLTQSMGTKLTSGDSHSVVCHIFDKIIGSKPELTSKLKLTGDNCTCPHCGNQDNVPTPTQTIHHQSTETKIIPAIKSALQVYSNCEGCEADIDAPVHIPKYFFFHADSPICFDNDNFSWKNRNFRVLSGVEKGTGHATCTIRDEKDGKWYKYDDAHVRKVEPVSGGNYRMFLIQNLSFQD